MMRELSTSGKNVCKGSESMKTWKKTRVSGAERAKRLWRETGNTRGENHVESWRIYTQMFDFDLRVNMMLLNSFKQGSWTILQGSGLGRGKEGKPPDHRKLHNTLQRRPLGHFGLNRRKGRVPSTCQQWALTLRSMARMEALILAPTGTDQWPPRNCNHWKTCCLLV